METMNAVIRSADILVEDHGILTATIQLDYGDSMQGFGGYAFYSSGWKSPGPNALGVFVWKVLEVAEVSAWSELPGRTIRVKTDHASIHSVGHITRNLWFKPRETFDKMRERPVETR